RARSRCSRAVRRRAAIRSQRTERTKGRPPEWANGTHRASTPSRCVAARGDFDERDVSDCVPPRLSAVVVVNPFTPLAILHVRPMISIETGGFFKAVFVGIQVEHPAARVEAHRDPGHCEEPLSD